MPLTNPTIRAVSAGGGVITGGTVSFSNANNITFGINGQTITASVAPGGGAGDGYNIIAAGTQTANTTGTIVFSNANNVTFGMDNSSVVTASVTVAATPETPFGISAGTQSVSTGTLVYSNSNGVSFGMSGSSRITASVDAIKSISGGTTRVTNGEIVFSDANNVSFGVNGQTITATASYSQSTAPSGIAAGAATATSGTVIFSNSNNVSFGLNGQTMTATASFAAQTNQTLGLYALGNTTGQSSSSTHDARTISYNGAGIVSVGNSNGSFVISATVPAQTNQTIGAYALGNTTGQSSSTTFDARTLSVNGAGIVSVGYSAGSLAISATVAAQTNQTIGAYAVGNTTGQSSSTTFDARTFSINGAGMVSVGYSAGSLAISATQSVQTAAGYAVSNTTQQTSGTIDVRSLSFQGRGIASVGVSNGSIVISVPSGGGAGDGVNIIAAGTQTANTTGTVMFSNSNNVTFGMSNSSIVTASFERSEITAGSNISLSSAGSTVSIIGVPASARWITSPFSGADRITNITVLTQRPLFFPFEAGGNVTAPTFRWVMSRSTSGSNNFTVHLGMYTYSNATRIDLLGSTSFSYSASDTASISGIKMFQGGVGTGLSTLSSGQYILGLIMSATATASMNYSFLGGSTSNPANNSAVETGGNAYITATSYNMMPFWGRYSTTSGGLPSSVPQSAVIAAFTGASAPLPLAFTIAST